MQRQRTRVVCRPSVLDSVLQVRHHASGQQQVCDWLPGLELGRELNEPVLKELALRQGWRSAPESTDADAIVKDRLHRKQDDTEEDDPNASHKMVRYAYVQTTNGLTQVPILLGLLIHWNGKCELKRGVVWPFVPLHDLTTPRGSW